MQTDKQTNVIAYCSQILCKGHLKIQIFFCFTFLYTYAYDLNASDNRQWSLTAGSSLNGVVREAVNIVKYLKRSLSTQALEQDGSDAPQVSLGIIVLGHDDFRRLVRKQNEIATLQWNSLMNN